MKIVINSLPVDFHWDIRMPLTVYWINMYYWSEKQDGRIEYIVRDASTNLFLEVNASSVSVIDSSPSYFWHCVKTEFVNGDCKETSSIVIGPDCWVHDARPNDYLYRFLWERPDSAEFLEFSKMADLMDSEFEHMD